MLPNNSASLLEEPPFVPATPIPTFARQTPSTARETASWARACSCTGRLAVTPASRCGAAVRRRHKNFVSTGVAKIGQRLLELLLVVLVLMLEAITTTVQVGDAGRARELSFLV